MHVHKMLQNMSVCLEGDDFRFRCQRFTIKYTLFGFVPNLKVL